MTYSIEYHEDVWEDLREIPANLQARIQKAIERRLGSAPDAYGARLSRDLAGLWKLRVGDYRVVFAFDPPGRLVRVLGIRHRKGVYPEILRRRSR
ncbi:MAG: type II toxin-antitoxin system RelE/ParE family toxin [Chloroflexi bacterium]|nr:MAG: type II toxin-antitoxin system RelE/ParE family toxin [Chloroflexota bacterium]